MTCPECGEPFTTTDAKRAFCTPAHRRTFHDREKVRGRNLPTLVQAWRLSRNTRNPRLKAAGAAALAELCRLADAWAAEDRAANRPGALHVMQSQQGRGLR